MSETFRPANLPSKSCCQRPGDISAKQTAKFSFAQRIKFAPSSLINSLTHLCKSLRNDICSCQDAPSWHWKPQPCPCSSSVWAELQPGTDPSFRLHQVLGVFFAEMLEFACARLSGQPGALQVTWWTGKSCCSCL